MFALLLLQAVSAPLPPLHGAERRIACPVGGKTFTATSVPVYSTTGYRPDGKPYSDVSFPLPIPVCPDNGLVLFSDFTPAERTTLARLVAGPVYRRMRKTDSPFYRAYWVATKLGRPDADALDFLLPAIWQAKTDEAGRTEHPLTDRYRRALVAAADALTARTSVDDRIWFLGQAANALREMGDFAAAERERLRAAALIPQATRKPLVDYLTALRAVILRHDREDEPIDMIPPAQAAIACASGVQRTAFARAYCGRPDIAL